MTLLEKENNILALYAENPNLFDSCEHLISEDLWSTKLNQNKYKIIKHNHSKGIKTDVLLLGNTLTKIGYTRSELVSSLFEADKRIAKNINEYVNDLFEAYSKKLLLPILHNSHTELNSELGDLYANIDDIKSVINKIESIKNNLSIERSVLDIHDAAFEELLLAQETTGEIIGYSTGLKELDKLTCGLKQEVILVLAPPASGKTSLVVNLIKHVAIKQKKPVLVFSLEMPSSQLIKNIWANALEINSYGIRGGLLPPEDVLKIKNFRSVLKDNLVIDDTPSTTWQYMETKIRKMREKVPLETVIVVAIDYIQIMRNTIDEVKGFSSEEQLGLRANGLLELSKKYNLCMIELSQISRDTGKRENKEPTISDAKGSGALEANAVQVWGIYRPDYYEKEPMENGISLKGLCKITLLKNRYGKLGSVFTKFKGQYSAFEDHDINEQAF